MNTCNLSTWDVQKCKVILRYLRSSRLTWTNKGKGNRGECIIQASYKMQGGGVGWGRLEGKARGRGVEIKVLWWCRSNEKKTRLSSLETALLALFGPGPCLPSQRSVITTAESFHLVLDTDEGYCQDVSLVSAVGKRSYLALMFLFLQTLLMLGGLLEEELV